MKERISVGTRPRASRRHFERRGGIFARIRPSYLILIVIALSSAYLFIVNPVYRETLNFIRPGIAITAVATVSGYIGSAVLGLVLASLLLLKLGQRTVLTFTLITAAFALTATALYSQPRIEYRVLGQEDGHIAVVAGTPSRAVAEARGEPARSFRTFPNAQLALDALEEGQVGAVLIRAELDPNGVERLHEIAVLPDHFRRASLICLVLALLLGLLTFGSWTSREHPLAIFAELYVDLVRGIPMLVVLIYVGFVVAPAVRDASGGAINMTSLLRGIVGLTLGYAAYMAEIFRAGIEAVPKGQSEAARSLGLSSAQTMRYVVLPQAVRIVVPPLGNEFIAMLKDSSLLTILAVTEITQLARQHQARTFNTFETWNTAALLYLALTLAASSLLDKVERKTRWGR